jgi:hypothetical protein
MDWRGQANLRAKQNRKGNWPVHVGPVGYACIGANFLLAGILARKSLLHNALRRFLGVSRYAGYAVLCILMQGHAALGG